MEISHEQFLINHALKQGYNVKVSAVAGSGKTTTVLLISKLLSDKKILFFTYNRQLRDETYQKILSNNLSNIDIYTIHSFAQNVYKVRANTDDGLVEVLSKNKKHIPFEYDLIVIDEAQDLTPIYYHFILKVMNDNLNKNYQILILGDEKQCIYQFLGADSRFLTYADLYFVNNHEWKFLSLTKSFRLTHQISSFLNDIFFKKELIKPGRLNTYSSINYLLVKNQGRYSDGISTLASRICKKMHEYGEENVFILTPTTKTRFVNSLIKKIIEINEILYGSREIPIYTSSNDTDRFVDLELIKNKLVISTFHQTKGLERDVVFLLHFDKSYYDHFAINANKFELLNVTYVSATRAKSELWLVHDDQYPFMQWIDKDALISHPHVTFHNKTSLEKILRIDEVDEELSKDTGHASEIIKFLDFKIDNLIKSKFSVQEFITHRSNINVKIFNNIPSFITLYKNNKKLKEDVSNINGSLVSILYLIEKDYKYFIKHFNNHLDSRIKSTDPRQRINFDKQTLNQIQYSLQSSKSRNDIQALIYLTIVYISLKSGNIAQLNTINFDDCNWINQNDFRLLKSFLNNILKINNCEFETRFTHVFEKYAFTLVGDIDGIDHKNKIVYEFKFTNDTKIDHFYQLIVYRFLMIKNNWQKYKDYKFIVYNLRKNVSYELLIDYEENCEIVDILVQNCLGLNGEKIINENDFYNYVKDYKNLNLISNNLNDQINKIEKHISKIQNVDLYDLGNLDKKTKKTTTYNKFVILDFETLHYDQIPIQLGLIIIENNQIIKTEELYFEIDNDLNLDLYWEYVNVEIDKIKVAPSFAKQWNKIQKYFDGEYIIIAHNAKFDMRVLKKALIKYNLEIPTFSFFDSIKLMKILSPGLYSYSQPNLCAYFGIDYDAHNALEDVSALYLLIRKFINLDELSKLIETQNKLVEKFWNI